ncbi:MAG: ferrous iron transport protein B [Desulfobacterales bacterium]|nr:ferrous iron transport protein B [Desulfobacterales bacterium]
MKSITVALAGNPNCGKTTIFNNLTGARQKVGNWPGVTVEKKEGRLTYKDLQVNVVDLPGTYSLTPFSIEEVTARDYILNESPDIVINIIDASNLERSLFLALQILELGRPALFVLNMADMAEAKGIKIHADKLSELLDLPVVFTVGNKNRGTSEILAAALKEIEAFEAGKTPRPVKYGREIEACIDAVGDALSVAVGEGDTLRARWQAIKLLEDDKLIKDEIEAFPGGEDVLATADTCRTRIRDLFQDDFEIVLTDDRYGVIEGLLKVAVTLTTRKRVDMSRQIDLVLTDRFFGIPVFIFFIWAMFQLTFTLGAYPMEWIEAGVSMISGAVDKAMAPSLLKSLVLDGIIAGIGSVIMFLPNILILFFCIALFEDTGYMARAAFLMDRVMHTSGLHGKSFIPMLMGFGCNVPAIMATRALENRKDRILTILMTPFMSCSARLPVYIVLAGTFFAHRAGTVIFCLYAAGILFAILSGRILRKLLFQGEEAPFVMELPPYRVPMLKSLMIHMWDRSKMFLKKMGGVILVGSVIIWVLSTFPRQVTYSTDYEAGISDIQTRYEKMIAELGSGASDKMTTLEAERDDLVGALLNKKEQERVAGSYIGMIGRTLEPVFQPIGIGWQASVALVTGFVAKEVVVSTMGVLYGVGHDHEDEGDALANALRDSGMTPQSALSMMVFVLLYVPCFATVVAIYREASPRWAWFNVCYTTVVAWGMAFLVYQAGMMLK